MKYLNPMADLTFKKVFGEHPDLVTSFLNALLPFETPEEEITLAPPSASVHQPSKLYPARLAVGTTVTLLIAPCPLSVVYAFI